MQKKGSQTEVLGQKCKLKGQDKRTDDLMGVRAPSPHRLYKNSNTGTATAIITLIITSATANHLANNKKIE
jgi:hypothetical protein